MLQTTVCPDLSTENGHDPTQQHTCSDALHPYHFLMKKLKICLIDFDNYFNIVYVMTQEMK